MTEPALKPCPFCGVDAMIAILKTFEPHQYRVECPVCNIVTSWYVRKNDEQSLKAAVDLWNQRV